MDREQILIVDDDDVTLRVISMILEGNGYSTKSAPSPSSALKILSLESFQVVISDIYFQFGISGSEFIHLIGKKYPLVKIILISGRISGFSDMGIDVIQNKNILFCMNKSSALNTELPKCLESYFSSK